MFLIPVCSGLKYLVTVFGLCDEFVFCDSRVRDALSIFVPPRSHLLSDSATTLPMILSINVWNSGKRSLRVHAFVAKYYIAPCSVIYDLIGGRTGYHKSTDKFLCTSTDYVMQCLCKSRLITSKSTINNQASTTHKTRQRTS
jgi:hypothetical protein